MIRLRIYLLLIMLACFGSASAELVVVVNKNNDTVQLSRHQVIDIYMGRTQSYPNGKPAMPLDYSGGADIKRTFYRTYMNKRLAEINAYWAKLLFTGRASPPRIVSNPELLLDMVAANPSAIGYIDKSLLDDRVKVVAHVE